jgi:beta-mannosidase
VLPVVKGEDPGREYLSSSPSDGKETVAEGYVAKDPDSEFYGDSKIGF